MVEKYYFTFSIAHPFHKYYVEVIGGLAETRKKMISVFGDRWAFQYTKEEIDTLKQKHAVKKLITF